MKFLLVLLVLVAVATVGLGFYFDWFQLSKSQSPDGGQTEIRLKVDKDRVKEDLNTAKEKARSFGQENKNKE